METINPLSKEQIQNLRDSLDKVNQSLYDCDRAERAGLDVTDLKAKLNEQKVKISKLLNEYG